ncbi:MAG: SIMPL domain-containing protein [Armatimonadaceae bacterium]
MYGRMKAVLAAGALLMAVSGGSVTPVWAQNPVVEVERPFLMAQGVGEVSVKPNVARISVGVQTEAKQISEAVQENARRMEAVIQAMRRAGVAEKDIATINYSIFPTYDPPRGQPDGRAEEPTKRGYQVSNMVRVTVRNIGDAGKVVDAATGAGANSVGGISLELSEDEQAKAYSEALTQAVRDARQKVVSLARASEAGAIYLYSVTEQGADSGPQPMFKARTESFADASTPIVAGQQTVRAAVTVRYTFLRNERPNY